MNELIPSMARGLHEGKVVVGWYVPLDPRYLIVPAFQLTATSEQGKSVFSIHGAVEVPQSSIAFYTGKKDKNGNGIFGSMGEWKGGDSVKISGIGERSVWWSESRLQYVCMGGELELPLCHCDELEIGGDDG